MARSSLVHRPWTRPQHIAICAGERIGLASETRRGPLGCVANSRCTHKELHTH